MCNLLVDSKYSFISFVILLVSLIMVNCEAQAGTNLNGVKLVSGYSNVYSNHLSWWPEWPGGGEVECGGTTYSSSMMESTYNVDTVKTVVIDSTTVITSANK